MSPGETVAAILPKLAVILVALASMFARELPGWIEGLTKAPGGAMQRAARRSDHDRRSGRGSRSAARAAHSKPLRKIQPVENAVRFDEPAT